jgi:hypothetical protein
MCAVRKRQYILWDLLLVASAAVVVLFPSIQIIKLREHRSTIAQMAETLVEHQAERVALPISMRPEVPQLLKKGITPVLYEPSRTAPQQFALLNVTHRIEEDPPSLTRLDIDRLRSTPIPPGKSIREEFSRPYIYPPIQPSLKLTPKAPLERSLFLTTGTYELSLEVFSKRKDPKPTISIQVSVRGRSIVQHAVLAKRVVHTPAIVQLNVLPPGGEAALIITSSAPAFVHAWEIVAK